MNRIDPTRVAEFFKTHREIRPTQTQFIAFAEDNDDYENVIACCGLTSLVVDNEDRDFTTCDLIGKGIESASHMIAPLLGVDVLYAQGFANGWDNYHDAPSRLHDDPSYKDGHKDGQEAYRLTMEALR